MDEKPPTLTKHGWARWRRPALVSLLSIAVLWALAWFAVPPLVKSQLEKHGSQALARELRIGAIEIFPSRLAIALHDVTVAAAAGSAQAEAQLRIDRLYVDMHSRSLLKLAPVVESLQIDQPTLRLARQADGRTDVDDLLKRFTAPPSDGKPAEPVHFALFNLQLRDGHIVLDDQAVGRRHDISRLNLDLPFLSNLPENLQVKVQPHLSFVMDGSAVDIGGQSTPFAEGRASQFTLRLSGLDLAPWWAYAGGDMPLRLTAGMLDTDLVLRFEQSHNGDNHVGLSGTVGLSGLRVHDASDAPLIEWQRLQVQIAELLPLERRVEVQRVALEGARLFVERDAAGSLNLQQLLPRSAAPPAPQAAASAAASAASAPAGWHARLGELAISGSTVEWSDAVPQAAVALSLRDITLHLQHLQWPVESDASLTLDAALVKGDTAMGQLHVQGPLSEQHAKLAFDIKDLQAAVAEPYLQNLRPRLSAQVQATGDIDWAIGDKPTQVLNLVKLRIDDLLLSPPDASAGGAPKGQGAVPLAKVARIELQDLRVDLLQQQVQGGSLLLRDPYLDLARDADGRLSVDDWWVQTRQPAADEPAAASAASDWHAELGAFKIDGGRLRLTDAKLGPTPLELTAIAASASRLAWPLQRAQPPLQTSLSMRLQRHGLDSVGRLEWQGQVDTMPPAVRGRLRVERFPVQVFEPYFEAALPVVLQHAEAGFAGTVDLRLAGDAWRGKVAGDALVADLKVLARNADADELLRWDALAAKGLSVDLAAGSKPLVEITELSLADYYARLEITEQGRLNLQTIAAGAPAEHPAQAASTAAPAAAASAAVPSDGASRWRDLPIDLVLGGVALTNGTVQFEDHFIKPNYSAELTQLTGHLGRFDTRSQAMAGIELKGRVAGTGLLHIDGALNPTTEPPSLDINAKASDIELPGLTPYSAKYAGYPIERGKLSVKVHYKVDADGKLQASNNIVINQLTFGEKTDSPDATTLPVRLAVALLQDSHGVIDIDLPVSGSINDPQFSLGGLIVKAIVNLLTKAVTAPFALVAGGGADLSVVEFQPGSAAIDAKAQQVIDKVAKALADRPALKLTITGQADAGTEAAAMRRAAVQQQVLDEQRRERARGSLGSTAADAPLPPLTAAQHEALIKRLYEQAKLPDKPKTALGTLQSLPAAQMQARLEAAVKVDDATVHQLAVARARAVREALIAAGLDSSRLFLAEPKPDAKPADNAAAGARAQLSLSAL